MDFMVFLSQQWLLVAILTVLVTALIMVQGRLGGETLTIHGVTFLVNGGSAIILDIREAKEYKAGHITDAVNIPFAKLADRIADLEKHKEKTIVVVDKMGQMTGAAVKTLTDKGFSAKRMQGGMAEWAGQNLPVIKG